MCFRRLFMVFCVCLVASSLLVLAQGPPASPGPPANPGPPIPESEWVVVDCDNGGSINEALQTPAKQLYIEIQGICEEKVVVDRNSVFLLGTPDDGVPDGIIAPDIFDPEPEDGRAAVEREVFDSVALLLRNARFVYVGEGLNFASGLNGWGAVRVVNSLAVFENFHVQNLHGWGMIVEDSSVFAYMGHFRDNDEPGQETTSAGAALVTKEGVLALEDCDITYGIAPQGEPAVVGVTVGHFGETDELALGAGKVWLNRVPVQAQNPVRAVLGSTLFVEESRLTPIPANGRPALNIRDRSTATVDRTILHGGFRVQDRSQLTLRNVSQFEEGMYDGINSDNRVFSDSTLLADQNCYLTGTLRVNESIADIRRSVLEAFGGPDAVWAGDGSSIILVDVHLLGSFNVFRQSQILLAGGMTQEEIPNSNRIGGDSYLDVWDAQIWRTNLDTFSRGEVHVRENRIHGELTCEHGSDVFCREPVVFFDAPDSGFSTCGLCPSPTPPPPPPPPPE